MLAHADQTSGHHVSLIGALHYILLHFPIVLIYLMAASELLYAKFPSPLFSYASRFMALVNAFLAPLAALFGFILAWNVEYGVRTWMLETHRYLGVTIGALSILLPFLQKKRRTGYLFILALLVLLVTLTGLFGGILSFF